MRLPAVQIPVGPVDLDHVTQGRRQLARAVIASTIGTTIEWYDFFLYSIRHGRWCSPSCTSRNSDPLVGTLQAFGIYAVGFLARPGGAAIFGHYGDRIGRKSTLIATLLLMGFATFAVALVPTYDSIGIWGAVLLTVLRFIQGVGVGGEWGGSVLLSMEWAQTNAASRLHCVLAAVRRAGGPVPRQPGGARISAPCPATPFLDLGLARPVPAEHRAHVAIGLYIRLRIFETPVFARLVEQENDRARADARGAQAPPEGDPAVAARAHGASRRRSTSSPRSSSPTAPATLQRVARFPARRGDVPPRSCRSSRSRSSAICRTASAGSACLPDRRVATRHVRLRLFRAAGYAARRPGSSSPIVISLIPHDMMYGPQAALIAESFTGAAALQRRIAGLPARLHHRRRSGAADRGGAASRITAPAMRSRAIFLLSAIVEPGRDAAAARLHKQGYLGTLKTDPNGSVCRLVAVFISKEANLVCKPTLEANVGLDRQFGQEQSRC